MRTNNTTLCAFRARMKKRGYEEIHIKYNKTAGAYDIIAIEPLGKNIIFATWTAEAIYHGFRF